MKYVILAGGSGTRLWPLSRKNFAKQFLSLTDDHSMIQNTALRVSKENGSDIYVVSNEASSEIIFDQLYEVLPEFKKENLIIEPVGRNTAPAIAYSTLFFKHEDVIAILSADHFIKDSSKFNKILEEAGRIAAEDYIVTLGIVPDSPKTGYGYIKKSGSKIGSGFIVDRFVEKPDLKTAKAYIESGEYFWNAGMFIFKVSLFRKELNDLGKDIYDVLIKIEDKLKSGKPVTVFDFTQFRSTSIDYALMEKTKKLAVIPADIEWNDIGGFKSLYEVSEKDQNGNAVKTDKDNFINEGSSGLLVTGDDRIIAAIDIKNIAIIDTKDALLISDISSTEKVKNIYDKLLEQKSKSCYELMKSDKPWGCYEILNECSDYIIKRITVKPGHEALINHNGQSTKMITVLKGSAEIISGKNIRLYNKTDALQTGPSEDYIVKTGKESIEIIEISYLKKI